MLYRQTVYSAEPREHSVFKVRSRFSEQAECLYLSQILPQKGAFLYGDSVWAGFPPAPKGPGLQPVASVTYTFEHDPEAGAFYIRVRKGDYHETIPLGEPGFGAGVDVDAEGNVLGFEFLSFEEYVEAINHAGVLEVPERLETTPDESGAGENLSPVEIMATLTPR
jgi:uncharacterized protein YuzE